MKYKTEEIRWILKDLSTTRRNEILSILNIKNKFKVFNGLLKYLNQPDAVLVGSIIMLLEELCAKYDKKVRMTILAKLKDKNEWVRERAADALIKIGNKDCVDYLIKALKDSNAMVRSYACEALGNWGDKKVLPALRRMLKDKNGLVRACAVEALGKLSDRTMIPTFNQIFKMDKDELVRDYAAEVLSRFKKKKRRYQKKSKTY